MYSARCRERLYPDDGFTAYRTIETGNGDELDRINYTYDNSTKNVVQRWRGPITGDAKVEWDNYFQNGGTEDNIDSDYWSNDWWIYKGIILTQPPRCFLPATVLQTQYHTAFYPSSRLAHYAVVIILLVEDVRAVDVC